jgi:hypothetical protein
MSVPANVTDDPLAPLQSDAMKAIIMQHFVASIDYQRIQRRCSRARPVVGTESMWLSTDKNISRTAKVLWQF